MTKIIFLSLTILSLSLLAQTDASSDSAFPANRVAAQGTDRNALQTGENQAGTQFMGSADQGTQVSTCPGCENRPLLLTTQRDSARPGVEQPSSTDPANTGSTGK